MRSRWVPWVVAAALAVTPAAVGAGSLPQDACSMLSADEVAAVIGGPVDPGERHDSGRTNDGSFSATCVWKLRGAPAGDPDAPFGGAGFAMLNTAIWPKGSGQARKYLQDFRDAAQKHDIDMVPVPVEAGDEALWWGDGVAVAKGDVSFGVSVHTGTDKMAEQAMEEALARKVAARL